MLYRDYRMLKRRATTFLSVLASLLLLISTCLCNWAVLTLPKHKYVPKIGEWVGPENVTSFRLGLLRTSLGSYATVFQFDAGRGEVYKINMTLTFLLVASFGSFVAGVLRDYASTTQRRCVLFKSYKGSALLNVLSVVLTISGLVVWFWFVHGFTHGPYTLGASLHYDHSVYMMLSASFILIIAIALDFISCKRVRRYRSRGVTASRGAEDSDIANVISPPASDEDMASLSPPPPPYTQ